MTIQENVSLRPYNTFGIDVRARYFAAFSSREELSELLEAPNLQTTRHQPLILGGGSNLLFTGDFDGLVLKNELGGIEKVREDEDFVYLKAGAGEGWHRFVQYCLAHEYAGVENLSLIPGNVGASPMQNIGAYGVEIKDVFEELEAFHLQEKYTRIFTREACGFGYRESVFKRQYRGQFVITSVTYRLRKKPVFNTSYGAIGHELEAMGVKDLSIQAIAQAVINIRTSKLPDWREVGNAGSFFKNPTIPNEQFQAIHKHHPSMPYYPSGEATKLPAGWLIEQCGWKGFRKGDAGCYPKQALVLVNYGSATGGEVFELSEKIIRSVQEKFGIELEREVNIV
ncbi:UDP-N-acetylmuramate dehydrogenase [Paraflavisolibacter sp. H34]|uniref:UDP-N-acetylmuramate dehydrogenase n=1 Tax=Huijunlia imazamoxiresistens TaxID=3127457 RepID=UPI0030199F96